MNIKPFEYPFYLGHSNLPCPYLPDRPASLLFLDSSIGPAAYRQLLDAGYRRHGRYMYRPDCPGCSECKILRVPAKEFRRSKDQRRVWNRAKKLLTARIESPSYDSQKAELYRRYLEFQHQTKDTIDEERYTQFFVDTFLGDGTKELQLLDEDELIGIGIVDIVEDALSSVYFFFDPDYAKLSPGTFSILLEIELAKAKRCRYYYLGYYVAGCAAMNYKARFRPCEIKDCDADDWQEL